MSRDSNGNYSLYTPGNPVVTATTISSSWANQTLSDMATAMTDSLSRSAKGGMLAALRLFDGTIGVPGLSWTTENTSGLYRAGAGDFRWSQGGVDIFSISSIGITQQIETLSGAAPRLKFNETDAAANNRLWDFTLSSEQFLFRVGNDLDNSYSTIMSVDRTLNVVDNVTFPSLVNFTMLGTSGGVYSVEVASARPSLAFRETDAASNEKVWVWDLNSKSFGLKLQADTTGAPSATAILVDRGTGTAVSQISFPTNTVGAFVVGSSVNPAAGIITSNTVFVQPANQSGPTSFQPTVGFPALIAWNSATAGDNSFMQFGTEAGFTSRGSITYNRAGGLTVYNTTSDKRRKKNIEDAPKSGSLVDSIRIRQFDWIDSNTHLDFWLVAQELHAVFPVAVTVGGDNSDWAVDPSKLVPLLVKEVQDLRARVSVLEH